jgi:hypothetical protein
MIFLILFSTFWHLRCHARRIFRFPPLAKAITTIETSGQVKILVNAADIYDTLFHAVTAWQAGDIPAFGLQMGTLLQELRASGCASPLCIVLQGVLASAQLEAGMFGTDRARPVFCTLV